jgi:hypothetical protein
MPPRRTPTIATKLVPSDLIRFDTICRLEGKTKTEIARKAIREYIERHEKVMTDDRESLLEDRIRRMENRLAGLLVKLGIGIYKLDHLFWTRTDKDVRGELFRECHAAGVKKMKEKLTAFEEELRQSMRA